MACVSASMLASCISVASAVTVPLLNGGEITIDVGSVSAFRLSVRFGGWGPAALSTPMLDSSRSIAPSSPVSWGGMTGLRTSFGALLAATDGSGAWALYDAANDSLVASAAAPYMYNGSATQDAGIVLPVNGTAAANGPARPCLGNGLFGPPFYYNRDGGYLSFAVSSWDWDPAQHHCYPVAFNGGIGGRDACDASNWHIDTDVSGAQRSSDYPNGLNVSSINDCCAACNRDATCSSFVWSDGTNPDPAGNCWPLSSFSATIPRSGRTFGGTPPPPPVAAWWAMGTAVDWYLAPAASPLNFTSSLYALTGAAAVPPRYAVGFMATYWGYDDMEEVEGNMTAFRDGAFPIDSFIMDYDWFLNNDADVDFGYDAVMFGNHTFLHPPGSSVPNVSTSGPVQLFAHFHNDISMHFGGIRKPRSYSNIPLSNASGWLLPDNFSVGAGNNNWNMSAAGWADWYAANTAHFLVDGLDFFWNDEGETQWFTYTWWNAAQATVFNNATPGKRVWSLNRAFQPGMQRVGAVTWTGDRQDCSHATVLTFTVAGQPYTACDMTAPDATILVRQYQNAVFLPIMRTHAMHGTPRFPYLWGGADVQQAFRAALNLRMHFLPHIYSLMHHLRATGAPLAMPASYVFPDDPTFPPALGDATYMFSDVLLPADVCTSNGFDSSENTTHVNIPPGVWYNFNSTAAVVGPQPGVTYTNVALDAIILFVRAGAILTLNAGVAQQTSELGGLLELHVYAGRDGTFTLVEDDGATTAYQGDANAATRQTTFTWNDAQRVLSWTVAGAFNASVNLYTSAAPVLFSPNATAPVYHAAVALGVDGSIAF